MGEVMDGIVFMLLCIGIIMSPIVIAAMVLIYTVNVLENRKYKK